jgi:AraC-like DNA-binding protein
MFVLLDVADMAPHATDFAPVQFSTRELPERDRIPRWREEFGRWVVRSDIEPLSDVPFHADATLRALPGLRLATSSGSAMRLERTAALAADGNDDIGLFINLGQKAAISNRGRDAVLTKGDAILVGHDPSVVVMSPGGFLGVVMPQAALASRVDDVDSAVMRPIRLGNVPLRLLTTYLRHLNECDLGEPKLRRTVATHIGELAAQAAGMRRDAREQTVSAVAAARFGAVRAHIAACFDEPDLTVAAVARRLGVSVRYLQRLFEIHGTSYTAYVNELRLQKVFALLTEPPVHRLRISDIALKAGFSDISHFNRLFRVRFGDTPFGVRAGSGKKAGDPGLERRRM